MPHHQRRLIGPLQVVDDQHGGSGRTQLVHQRHQHLHAGHRRIAVREQPQPPAAQQVGGPRPPRIRRTRPHLQAVQHHPQRQPLGELIRHPPPDVPPRVAVRGQGLGHQGRLADAGLALDPDHRSLTTAKGLDTSTQDRQLLRAANPLRRPANRPHGSNVCPARSQCLGKPGYRSGRCRLARRRSSAGRCVRASPCSGDTAEREQDPRPPQGVVR